MKWLLRIVAALVLLVAAGVGLLYASGNGAMLQLAAGFFFGAPGEPFDPELTVPAPDYADPASWAALPGSEDGVAHGFVRTLWRFGRGG